jgi:hypothetical protein
MPLGLLRKIPVVGGIIGGVADAFDKPSTGFQAEAPPLDPRAFSNPSRNVLDFTEERAFRPEIHRREAQQVTPQQAQAARIQTGASDAQAANAMAARGQQQQALGLLSGAAQGTAPSVAQQQLQQGMDAGLRQQAAMAASARGGGGGQLMAQRDAAMQGAQLQQQTAGNAAMLRAQEMAQARGQFADMTSGIRAGDQSSQQLAMQQAQAQAGLTQQAMLANQQAGLGAGIANQQAGVQMAGLDDAQQRAMLEATLGINSQTMQGQIEGQRMHTDNILRAQAIQAGVATGEMQAQAQHSGGILGALGAGAAILSDESTKRDIKPTDTGKIRIALGALKPSSWEYKPEYADDLDGEHHGIIAQDLAKTEVGKSLLTSRGGKLAVDVGRATGFSLGALADINKRLERIEKGKAA